MSHLSRRSFVKASAGLLAAAGVSGAPRRAVAANEKVRLGFIACGGRAKQLMRIFKEFPDVEIVAISDVMKWRMDEAEKLLGESGRTHYPQRYDYYEKMLERDDLHAVTLELVGDVLDVTARAAVAGGVADQLHLLAGVYAERPLALP